MDLMTRRCGCGKILRQRETCPVCTQKRREELHARGVGVSRDEQLSRALYQPKPNERVVDVLEMWAPKQMPPPSLAGMWSERRMLDSHAVAAFTRYLASFANHEESRFERVFRREMEGKQSGPWQPEHARAMPRHHRKARATGTCRTGAPAQATARLDRSTNGPAQAAASPATRGPSR